MGLTRRKPFLLHGNNKSAADQPAHLCSLVSAFVTIFAFWKSKKLNFPHNNFNVAEQADFSISR